SADVYSAMMARVTAARDVMARGIDTGVFPAAAVDVGSSGGSLWNETFATGDGTPFDLASLTKVIATTSVALQLLQENRIQLDDAIASYFAEWRGEDREHATVRDLLEHASGLAPRLVHPSPHSRREFEHEI